MSPHALLTGKVALVTGAASGFGEGIAKLFADEGAKIVVADINDEQGARVVKDIERSGGQAVFARTDVTKEADWKKALETAKQSFGTLDILVNNAGWTYRKKDSLTVTEQEYDRVFDINVKSIFHSVNAIIPHFLSQSSGTIVNIGSCITCKPTNGLMWYGATKAAVDVITRHMAREFSDKGIRVNAVAPSISETPLMKEFIAGDPDEESLKDAVRDVPVGRLCTPVDIAKACLYFASDYFNGFQTGIVLRADGGHYA
ncbi:hypothetical protein M409DRAFT_29560 [Zasmidium cellare ATCC 36951]|uniref:Uncharacterized protein n=1 Tax=Zasmidium cellare ATCC 36951 TaxID=1080233 RepID=A0A6A6BYT3_ZASCE|nr:uncharacterized protein M409DRAFT_29560 [Zasmidium cellare ATCC 36951]KAF2159951.1 hypothetical protein M409DRAFT_29560 [Zasmidium cellare ATCC 36951]